MKTDQVAILLTTASTYANSAASIFNMFLTVFFGSLAFAASIDLKKIGGTYYGYSESSLLIAAVLLVFYTISFISFQRANYLLKIILNELHAQMELWPIKKSTLVVFQPEKPVFRGVTWPSIGFLAGSLVSLWAFLWISNATRL